MTINKILIYISAYIETRHDEPAKMLIADLGGWPVLDAAWDSTDFDWVALTVKLRMYNNRPLINQWVSSDDKNSTVNIIQVCENIFTVNFRKFRLNAYYKHGIAK